jgi:hypothetical protein
MKSRRRISFPEAWDYADCALMAVQLQQGSAAGEMGLVIALKKILNG